MPKKKVAKNAVARVRIIGLPEYRKKFARSIDFRNRKRCKGSFAVDGVLTQTSGRRGTSRITERRSRTITGPPIALTSVNEITAPTDQAIITRRLTEASIPADQIA